MAKAKKNVGNVRKGHYWPGEEDAIESVLKAGRDYGFGNMISQLERRWGEMLALGDKRLITIASVLAWQEKEENA